MTSEFNRDLMVGMLRKGQTGNQILDILNLFVPSVDESQNDVMTDVETPVNADEFFNEIADIQQEEMMENYTVAV